ncbi:MAG: flagellin [Phycisphaerae bacterium]|nr:flagellin [Phycisphaerae bacterium]
MSRINTNVASLIAQRTLGSQNMGLNKSLQRLSTGLAINRGADDPAGLIASENLRSEKAAINAAITNAERAEQVVNVAEGGLQEVSNLLVELQSLVSSTANEAGVSDEEKDANQLQIDSILQTIDRIANATEFQGEKLLNGNFDYQTSGGNLGAELSDVKVNSAKLASDGTSMNVSVDVTASATTGAAAILGNKDSATAGRFDNDGNSYTIEVTGEEGTQQFTFADNTAMSAVRDAINSFSDQLGVTAALSANGDDVVISSAGYGSDSFVRVRELNDGGSGVDLVGAAGTFSASDDYSDNGTDATVLINGTQATTDGLTARVASAGFDVEITLDAATGNTAGSWSFDIDGGGANFNLAPDVSLASKVSLGIETVTTGSLGSSASGFLADLKSGGDANVKNGDLSQAQSVIDDAIKQVSSLRGRLGAFQKNVVGSTISSLGIALENTAAAESQIRDTDFAAETAALTRGQILQQAAIQSLSLANSGPQAVLSLLG